MVAEVMKDILDTNVFQELKDETIQSLLDEKQKIETSTELNWFQKIRKKLQNDIKLKLLWHEDTEDNGTTSTDKENTEIVDEIFDETKELIYINMVDENQEQFEKKTREISKKLSINPNRLMQIMKKESWLNHTAVNKDTNATWLIQFLPSTAKWLGTTVEELKNMSNIEQLDYVYKYYEKFWDKIKSHTDLYLATFYPAALWKPDTYIIWSDTWKEKIIGRQNKMNNGNPITVAHVKSRISKDIPWEYLAQFQTANTGNNTV